LPDEAKKLLEAMFPPQRIDPPTDDDIFGSAQPHKIGESWPVNSEIAAKDLSALRPCH